MGARSIGVRVVRTREELAEAIQQTPMLLFKNISLLRMLNTHVALSFIEVRTTESYVGSDGFAMVIRTKLTLHVIQN